MHARPSQWLPPARSAALPLRRKAMALDEPGLGEQTRSTSILAHRRGAAPRVLDRLLSHKGSSALAAARWVAVVLGIGTVATGAAAINTLLEEVTVTATLLPSSSMVLSTALISEREQRQRGAAHVEDVISLMPNVVSSSGASRNRFLQIRGIGERSQFVEPLNPSIGILLDGIDLSGSGGALTLFDVTQVEVLRGPQGTLMGANALGGLIALHSGSTENRIAELSAGAERFHGHRLGARWSGDLAPEWAGRLAIQQYESDGFIDNDWLRRSDTNAKDELTARGAIGWRRDAQTVEAGVYYIRINNGYDAFSLDNTRSTLSDQPGEDDLELSAARLNWQGPLGAMDSLLQISHASTETTYSYDEDWSYVGIAPGWEYSSFDQYRRERTMNSIEWRLRSSAQAPINWVFGTYLRDESEDLRRTYTYLDTPFFSDIETQTAAVFGEINTELSPEVSAFFGLRVERRDSEYRDSLGVNKNFEHSYWTGRTGVVWSFTAEQNFYATLARGARAGGANASLLASVDALPDANQSALAPLATFKAETLVSLELGWQSAWPQWGLESKVSLFTMDRDDQQSRGSLVIPRADGSTAFIDYTDNAAAGRHQGLEWELQWSANDVLSWRASAGLLDAVFDNYVSAPGENLSDRDQPQAPNWQYVVGATWQATPTLAVQGDVTGSDGYFFSDRHRVRAPTSHQVNASITGRFGAWQWTLWGRNLTDEKTFVRGFGTFGNDPRKEYAVEPYRQFGEPRMVGVSVSYDFLEQTQ